MAWLVVLEKMVVLVALILVGVISAKAGWIDARFSQMLSRLVMNVFIVCTILNSVVNVEPIFTGGELGTAILVAFVPFLVGCGVGFLVTRVLGLRGQARHVAWMCVLFMNNVFVGFPLVEAIFGPEAVFCASLTNIPFNLILYTLGVRLLHQQEGKGRINVREIFSVPLVATLAAIVIFLLQVPVPAMIEDFLSTMGAATVSLSMIIIGVSLSTMPMREALLDWRAYVVSLTRLVLCPVLTVLLMGLLLPEGSAALGVYTVVSACPSGAMIAILCVRFQTDDRLASKIIFLSTVLSALTLPLMTYFLL